MTHEIIQTSYGKFKIYYRLTGASKVMTHYAGFFTILPDMIAVGGSQFEVKARLTTMLDILLEQVLGEYKKMLKKR